MRTRSRQSQESDPITHGHSYTTEAFNVGENKWDPYGSTVAIPDETPVGGVSYAARSSTSFIVDDVEPNRSAKKCYHLKTKQDVSNEIVLPMFQGNSWVRYYHTFTGTPRGLAHAFFGLPVNQDPILSAPVTDTIGNVGVNTSELITAFNERLTTYIDSNVSTGENVAEPQLFIDAVRAIVSPRRTLRNLVTYVRKNYGNSMTKRKLGSVVKQISSDVSDAYLAYVFGVKPVAQDVAASFEAYDKIKAQMEFLNRNIGEFVPVRVRRGFRTTEPELVDGHETWRHCSLNVQKFESIESVSASCLARIRRDYTRYANFIAYSQYFGIEKVIGLAWELIPFSFVVDWVLNTGQFIDRWTKLQFGSPYTDVKNFCYTHSVSSGRNYYINRGYVYAYNASTIFAGNRLFCGRDTSVTYNRALNFPSESLLGDVSRLGLFHLVTSGALLNQRLVRSR